MPLVLLAVLVLILLFIILKQDIGAFSCFSILYFSVAVTLFKAVSPALFSLNAVLHVLAFVVLLIWQFNYYSSKTFVNFLRNPVILSIIAISIVIYMYNDYSPYYNYHKTEITSAQFGFYSRILFPLIILPLMIPDNYSRNKMIDSVPFWGVIYAFVFLSTFNISSSDFSIRAQIEDNSDGIINAISFSRIYAIATISTFLKAISTDKADVIKKYVFIFISFLFFLLTFMAGQRGTVLGMGIGFMALIYRAEFRKYLYPILFVLILLFFLLFLVGIGNLGIYQRFSEFHNIEAFERYHDYFRTWEIFQSNNYFWGLGSLGYLFKTGRCYPHNIILEHITDYGLVGLICILALLYLCFKYAFVIIRYSQNSNDIAIACGWIVLCMSAMVSSTLLNHMWFYTFSGLLAMTYMDFKNNQKFGIHE